MRIGFRRKSCLDRCRKSLILHFHLPSNSSDHLFVYISLVVILRLRFLVFAATDTTTSALAQTFRLIAQHPEVQERLRNEIMEAKLNAG